MAEKRLRVEVSECIDCRLCELVCSYAHVGLFRPSQSCIRISSDPTIRSLTPQVCIQCEEAPCVEDCPTDALTRANDRAGVSLKSDLCNSCGICAEVCPFDGVFLDLETGYPHICDLCNGNPQCVAICPTEALSFDD
jgi:Fe-S-cluster-containing hydrogenase component 2